MSLSKRLVIVLPALWLGFVLSISFMEAWLKFQPEVVTQSIGLSIGKLVFGALNKAEILFLITLVISFYKQNRREGITILVYILIALGSVLIVQTFCLLPILDQRADMIIKGEEPQPSYVHFYYIILEVIKVVLLCFFLHKNLVKTGTANTI